MSDDKKAKIYANPFTLHRYVGYEGKGFSTLHSDNKARALRDCAWVWDVRARMFIKRPKAEG